MAVFQDNPFFILDVSISDTKETIIEAAEEHSFDAPEDEDKFEKAKNILLNPKLRLNAEIGWFPGLGKQQEEEIRSSLKKKQLYQFSLSNPLAQLNLERYQLAYQQEVNLPEAVYRMDRVYSKIDSASVLEWIDQMRDIANYPHIQDEGAVAVALESLQEEIRFVIHEIAKAIPRQRYTRLANDAAQYISKPHGVILEDFFSTYELDITPYLHETVEQILDCIDKIKENVRSDDVDTLEKELRPWAKACRPIYLLKASLGMTFQDAEAIFWKTRSLAINVYNEKDEAELALRIEHLLKSSFPYLLAEDNECAEKVNEDISALEDIVKKGKGFRDAQNAFLDMRKTMGEKLFFEEGHTSEIMQFYRTVFRRNYIPTIEGFLNRSDILGAEKETLYFYAADLYETMANSLTWADEFERAHRLAEKGMVYAKKSSDEDVIASMQKLLDATQTSAQAETVSHPSVESSSASVEKSSGGGGCFLYLLFAGIGAAIAGPIGFFAGIWLAAKLNDN